MPKPMMFFVAAILFMPLAIVLATPRTSLAQSAADECKTKPDSSAPAGSHWYYRVNRTDQRHCWYLGPEGRKVRTQAREDVVRTSARENLPEMSRTMPAPMEPAQSTAAEPTPIQQPAGAADFVSPTLGPSKAPDLDARGSAASSNSDDQARTEVQEQMPLIWPVLAERESAALPETVRESAPWSAFLVGALALLFAAAIFKLARRHARSYRRDQWLMARPRLKRRRRAYSGHMAARPGRVARRSAVRTPRDDTMRQRPTSIDPAEATSLRKLMRELQRTAA
jgi:hypothetical protein